MSSKVSSNVFSFLLFWTYFCKQKESRLDSLLHSKACIGDVARVQQVLDSGRVDPDCKDQVGYCYRLIISDCVGTTSGWNHSSHAGGREWEGGGLSSP